MNKIIYIRCENNIHEHRVAVIPSDIKILIDNGYEIYIENSKNRVYLDDEYKNNGAIITDLHWYDEQFKDALIVGLKEIKDLEKLNKHTHLYFSHTYKNQINSKNILLKFAESQSVIHDFEYFTDDNNKRIISFGYYAGIMGCILGLLQYISKKLNNTNIVNLKYCDDKNEYITYIYQNNYLFNKVRIAIIGDGNCTSGVKYILDLLKIEYTIIYKKFNKSDILFPSYDIIYNCIVLDEKYNEIWFDNKTHFYRPIIICDISCDYEKKNNPIAIYNKPTTWDNPIYSYDKFVDIIAINNLPSLIPKESSMYFSNKCVQLILEYTNDINKYWLNNKKVYLNKISEL